MVFVKDGAEWLITHEHFSGFRPVLLVMANRADSPRIEAVHHDGEPPRHTTLMGIVR
jgi:hypothetical protein